MGLTKTAALEYAPQGVRVHCVCPGVLHTPMTAEGLCDLARRAYLIASEPMGQVSTPEERVETMVWLCSDAASFVTGHTITMDGGLSHNGHHPSLYS
jgi:NAD(P)-dependent dehydrogenase (short-subunit alcohol dehydrogenase family)